MHVRLKLRLSLSAVVNPDPKRRHLAVARFALEGKEYDGATSRRFVLCLQVSHAALRREAPTDYACETKLAARGGKE